MGERAVERRPEVAGELVHYPYAQDDIKETNERKWAKTHAESPGKWGAMSGSLAQAGRSCSKRPRSAWDKLLFTPALDPREAASDHQRNERDDGTAECHRHWSTPEPTQEPRQRSANRCRAGEDCQVDTHHPAAQPVRRVGLDGGIRQ